MAFVLLWGFVDLGTGCYSISRRLHGIIHLCLHVKNHGWFHDYATLRQRIRWM